MVGGKYKGAKKGRYLIKNLDKWTGSRDYVSFKSKQEEIAFFKLDQNDNVLRWSYETVDVSYYHRGRRRKYEVDIWAEVVDKGGIVTEYLFEVKHQKSLRPPKRPKRKTRRFDEDRDEFLMNYAKWETAHQYAIDRGQLFYIWTPEKKNLTSFPQFQKNIFEKYSYVKDWL